MARTRKIITLDEKTEKAKEAVGKTLVKGCSLMRKKIQILVLAAAMALLLIPEAALTVQASETDSDMAETAEPGSEDAENDEIGEILTGSETDGLLDGTSAEPGPDDQSDDALSGSGTDSESDFFPDGDGTSSEPEIPDQEDNAADYGFGNEYSQNLNETDETDLFETDLDEYDPDSYDTEEEADNPGNRGNTKSATISQVTLTGVTKPAANAYANTSGISLASNSHCTATKIEWYDTENQKNMKASDSFQNYYSYELRVILAPDSGYAFASSDSLSVNLQGISSGCHVRVTGGGGETRRFLWIQFDAINASPVRRIELDLLSAPTSGTTAQITPFRIESPHVKIGSTMYWYCLEDSHKMSTSETFEGEKTYQLIAVFLPYEGQTFAQPASIIAEWLGSAPDGYTVSVAYDQETNSLGADGRTVTFTFPKLPPDKLTIKSALLNYKYIPYVGESIPSTAAVTVPSGAKYTINDVYWMDSNGKIRPGGRFKRGETCELRVIIEPQTGYRLAEPATLATALNGIQAKRYESFVNWSDVSDEARLLRFRFQMPSFTDVTDDQAFYYKPVYWAAGDEITTGWADGTFRPWNTCNRAAIVTFLWRYAGKPGGGGASFYDMTGNAEFDAAISWASSRGIVTGWEDNTFRPWNNCNRASVITFLWRFAGSPMTYANSPSPFSDVDGTNPFYPAIMWGYNMGIITGYDDGTFRPWNTCNRAAVVSFLYRYSH